LVSHILVKAVINSAFKLFVVINVLYDPVNSIFETLNVDFVFADLGTTVFNQFLHLLLAFTKLIDCETKLTVDRVECAKLVVHLICLLFEFSDFSFSRSNVSLQLLNLVIKNELEFLKFLRFLLQSINNFFSVTYLVIFFVNFLLLLIDM